MALSSQNRITNDKDFGRILKKGKTVHGSFFFIKGCKNDNLQKRRFGIILSARVIKSAVGRNKVKRHLNEVFRNHSELAQGYDVVCSIRKDCSGDLKEARRQLIKLLGELS
ncbi:MAG: ribonuclease P protein component [Patescibacteria group bacterium]